MTSGTTSIRRVTEQKSRQANRMAFKAGNQRIIYSAEGDLKNELFQLELTKGQGPTQLELKPSVQDGGAWATDPDVSPDSSRVAFISDRAKAYAYDLMLLETASGRGGKGYDQRE
jgi:Tol biopolymer transport system component